HGLPGFQEAFNLLEEGSILSLEVNLSGDCDVEKNGKWSYIYADGSNEYQAVCTRPDIASANDGMLDGVDRSWKAYVHHMEALLTTKAIYMTLMKAKKEAIWLKRLSTDSGAKLKCVAVGATGALTKVVPGSRFRHWLKLLSI
ncbi:hypothetical protein Tco_0330214, partial [Tanacetum coccineum]